jgi:Type IV secretory system Conjugative DNA transfer
MSKRREGVGGALSGGKRFFARRALLDAAEPALPRRGGAQGQTYPGQHEAIIEPELWQIVQDRLAANRRERSLAVGAEAPSLLSGLIADADGNRLTPTHATKRGRRYRYYVPAALLASERAQAHGGMRVQRRNHWEKTSHLLLVGAILHVLYAEPDKTLAGVGNFLSDPRRPIETTLRAIMTSPHLGERGVHPVVASSARELLNKSDNERSGVLSTAMSFLGL